MKTYGPTMQCNSKTLNYVKYSKCPPMDITHALSLNHHRSTPSTTVHLSSIFFITCHYLQWELTFILLFQAR